MRSPRKVYIEKIRSLGVADDSDRYVDIACQVRLYRRAPDGSATPDRWLPTVYGGKYDTLSSRYVGPCDVAKVVEVTIHPGQLPLFEAIANGKRRTLGLGAPGGGKSLGIAKVGQCLAAWRPHSNGGVIAPTRDRLEVIWEKFLEILDGTGWISSVSPGKMLIRLRNGTKIKFVAAKKSSNQVGSPIAGKDWHWCIEDEQQNIDDDAIREVDARGRITKDYRVFSSATNEPVHQFQIRVQAFEASPNHKVIRFSGYDNCFTPLEHWDGLKQDWSKEDFDRYIKCEDVPQAGRVYPEFSLKESCTTPIGVDITASLTMNRYQEAFAYIVGFDPGITCHASVLLKCFQVPKPEERLWMVIDEITTRDKTTEHHAQQLVRWCGEHGVAPQDVLVLMDPHENKEADRSDILYMRQAGFTTFLSNGGPIPRRHRLSMVNALLGDVMGRRRLKLLKNAIGVPQANKLAEGLGHLMYGQNGEPDMKHKTIYNLAHWPDALGYGLFPFEHLRGNYKPAMAKATNRWALNS